MTEDEFWSLTEEGDYRVLLIDYRLGLGVRQMVGGFVHRDGQFVFVTDVDFQENAPGWTYGSMLHFQYRSVVGVV